MAQAPVFPVVLVILDGWGYGEVAPGNAIAAASTPVLDSLWLTYPHTLLQASGKSVGLPEGQMGNSEVGHLNLGAGRVVPQELVRISDAVEDGSLLHNQALVQVCEKVRLGDGKLHLVGLCSEGGVHSHISHLYGLLDLAAAQGCQDVCIHAITDGRDTAPTAGKATLESLQAHLERTGLGQIVTVSGRYYAMDRDHRWPRVEQAYRVMTEPGTPTWQGAAQVLQTAYDQGITDEFIPPVRLAPGVIAPGDGVICFNFRPDRSRQLAQAFVDPLFTGFSRELIAPLAFATFTQYDSSLPVSVAFEAQNLSHILGEVIAHRGLRQLRIAETEKYAHVTYFFNGGLEDPLPGEDRQLIPSPLVATYDQAPAMAAGEVTKGVTAALNQRVYSLVVVNYANPDMVGHTGNLAATIEAVETVDRCLGELLQSALRVGGTVLITADHGNAEYMGEFDQPWTAHTTNPVPFILVEGEKLKVPGHGGQVNLRQDGRLCDVAPTILEVLGLPIPPAMTGRSLILPAPADLNTHRSPAPLTL